MLAASKVDRQLAVRAALHCRARKGRFLSDKRGEIVLAQMLARGAHAGLSPGKQAGEHARVVRANRRTRPVERPGVLSRRLASALGEGSHGIARLGRRTARRAE